MKKTANKRRFAAMLSLALVGAITIGGTLAWRDFTQHKTNYGEGGTGNERYDIRLIEVSDNKFEDWTTNDGLKQKEIRVSNVGKKDNNFGDVYVRLALKEYMEIVPVTYTETGVRYMVDGNGAFIVFPTEADAQAAYSGHTVTKVLNDAVTPANNGKWFVQTQEGDNDGVYGKFVITNIESAGEKESIVSGVEKATDAQINHHKPKVGECLYTVHTWNGADPCDCGNGSHTQDSSYFEEGTFGFNDYVKWYLGDDVISLTEYLNECDGTYVPVAKWIYDDRADDGDGSNGIEGQYVYWGKALESQNAEGTNPNSTTSNLLENVELVLMPDGDFFYALHTDMESVSLDELSSKWKDAPPAVISLFTRTQSIVPPTTTSAAATTTLAAATTTSAAATTTSAAATTTSATATTTSAEATTPAPTWVQPISGIDSPYMKGDIVYYACYTWVSQVDNNYWTPGTAETVWKKAG